ncbi:unnamed protein product, partial [Discosporangium mesarthrocarpum]
MLPHQAQTVHAMSLPQLNWKPDTTKNPSPNKIRIVERMREISSSRNNSTIEAGLPALHPLGSVMGLGLANSLDPCTSLGGGGLAEAAGAGDVPVELRVGEFKGEPGDDLNHLLDDAVLNQIGEKKLEGLLDQMVIRVVHQLVRLASADSALEEELNALDSSGFSLLHYTCLYNLAPLVPVLLAMKGMDVNQKAANGQGQTPLHLAVSSGSLQLVKDLVRRGADTAAVDSQGLTPAEHALRCGKQAMSEWLAEQTPHDGEDWRPVPRIIPQNNPSPRGAFFFGGGGPSPANWGDVGQGAHGLEGGGQVSGSPVSDTPRGSGSALS